MKKFILFFFFFYEFAFSQDSNIIICGSLNTPTECSSNLNDHDGYVQDEEGDNTSPYVVNQLIVKFKEEPDVDLTTLGKGYFNIESLDYYSSIEGIYQAKKISERLYLLEFSRSKDVIRLSKFYKGILYDGIELFEYAAPNFIIETNSAKKNITQAPISKLHHNYLGNNRSDIQHNTTPLPNFPTEDYADSQWYFTGRYGFFMGETNLIKYNYASSILMDLAWNISQGNSKVTVGVIDNGLEFNNPEFHSRIHKKFIHNQDYINSTAKINYHANGVLSVLGANYSQNIGMVGVDWNAKFVVFDAMDKVISNYKNEKDIIQEKYSIRMTSFSVYRSFQYFLTGYNDVERPIDVFNFSFGAFYNTKDDIHNDLMFVYLDELYNKYPKALFVAAVGNAFENTDNSKNVFLEFAKDKQKERYIVVGGSNFDDTYYKEPKYGTNYGQIVSLVAPAFTVLALNNGKEYDYFNGTSLAAPMVSGAASLLKALNHKYAPTEISATSIKQILETTAEKYRFEQDESASTQLKYFRPKPGKNLYLANGRLNVHQALLVSSAHYFRDPKFIYEPEKVIGLKERKMFFDKVMFSPSGKYAMALNRHKITSYKLPTSESGTTVWDLQPFSVEQIKEKTRFSDYYASKLSLLNTKFALYNSNHGINWEVEIPFRKLEDLTPPKSIHDEGRRLKCVEFRRHIFGFFCSSANSTKELIDNSQIKAQWFELNETGELVVKRMYSNAKETIDWASDPALVDAEAHRFLLDDHLYKIEDQINNIDPLSDDEYLLSSDKTKMLLTHNGNLSVLNLDNNNTPNDFSDDAWVEAKNIFEFEGLNHPSHRLLINNGNIQFVGGSEDKSGNFNQTAILKSLYKCPSTGAYNNSNLTYEIKFSDDSRFLVVYAENNPFILVDIGSTTPNQINSTTKLIPIDQTPKSTDELHYLLSQDRSKLSFLPAKNSVNKNQYLIVSKKNEDGVFCLNEPI
jgi:hypothetical protein